MTGSRPGPARHWRAGSAGLVLLAAVLFAAVPGAEARNEEPRQLVPRQLVPRPGGEAFQPASAEPARPAAPVREDAATGVVAGPLGDPDPDALGTLVGGDGGFGAAMWADTPRPAIARLLDLLPRRPGTRTMRDLQRRLLLSAARVPPADGTKGTEGGGTAGDLLDRRARLLLRLGDRAGLDDLLDLVPASAETWTLARIRADHHFLRDDPVRACRTVRDWITRSGAPYWQKAMAFCHALDGNWDRVEFGGRLLRELGETDPAFFAALQALGGRGRNEAAAPAPAAAPRPLILAMRRAAGVPFPFDGLADLDGGTLLALLDDPKLTPQMRLRLAEAGETRGVLTAAALIRIHDGVAVDGDLLARALSVSDQEPGPEGRAVLSRAARAQTVAAARAQVAHLALTLARRHGGFARTARVYQEVLAKVPAVSQFDWLAGDAALALIAAGAPEQAAPWLDRVRRAALRGGEAEAAWARLLPLARLAGLAAPTGAGDAASVRDRDGTPEPDPEAARARAVALRLLQEALEDPAGERQWLDLVAAPAAGGPPGPDPAIRRALAQAAGAGRTGETVALACVLLGEAPAARTAPDTVAPAVSALSAIGLTAEARALAVEAALVWGL